MHFSTSDQHFPPQDIVGRTANLPDPLENLLEICFKTTLCHFSKKYLQFPPAGYWNTFCENVLSSSWNAWWNSFFILFCIKSFLFIARCCKCSKHDFCGISSAASFSGVPDACFHWQALYFDWIGTPLKYQFLITFLSSIVCSTCVFIALCLVCGRQCLKNIQILWSL